MAGVSILTVEINDPDKKSDHFVECTAIEELIRLLGMEKIIKLADLVGEVSTKTGYGDVRIVVAEGRVVTLKQEISYK